MKLRIDPSRQPSEVFARYLRENQSPAAAKVWLKLKDGFAGETWELEHPIGIFCLDFYCPRLRLAVEVDGKQHSATSTARRKDRNRDRLLRHAGIRTVRLTTLLCLKDLDEAMKRIAEAVAGRKR